MKKLTALLLALVMVVALAAVGMPTAAAAGPVHLKLNHPAADGGPYDLMAEEFARLVEEKSEGRYVIDIFPAGNEEECGRKNLPYQLQVSIGWAFLEPQESCMDCIERADRAMYQKKANIMACNRKV